MFCKQLGNRCILRLELPHLPVKIVRTVRTATEAPYLAISAALNPAPATIIV